AFLLAASFWAAVPAQKFHDNLYQLVAKEHANENVAVSPFAVELLLSMIYTVAEGAIAKELKTVLDFPADRAKVVEKFDREIGFLQPTNRIFHQSNDTLKPILRNFPLHFMDLFQWPGNAKNRTLEASRFVAVTTDAKLGETLPGEAMHARIRAVLMSMVQLLDDFRIKFETKHTIKGKFRVSGNKTVTVDMMRVVDTFKAAFFPDMQATVLEFPYARAGVSLLLFLPNEVDGLREMETKMVGFSEPLNTVDALVSLPRARFMSRHQLTGVLQKLGIRELFSDKSALNVFSGGSNLKLGNVSQNVSLALRENSAHATAASFQIDKQQSRRENFTFDRPFAFIVKDENTTYFQGHIVDP
ncbi:hypothetical protein KR018_000582, partial [Drosophila ironensis]